MSSEVTEQPAKYCKDCRFYHGERNLESIEGDLCTAHPIFDRVRGKRIFRICWETRGHAWECGENAVWFETKERQC